MCNLKKASEGEVNKIIVIGNMGRDPEMRYTPGGQAGTSFSIASNRKYKTAGGHRGDPVIIIVAHRPIL